MLPRLGEGGAVAYLGPVQEHLLALLDTVSFPLPCFQDGCLEGSAVRERKRPWLQHVDTVDRVQVCSSRRF